MTRLIESPVENYPGTVSIKDPVPYPDFIEWERAVKNANDPVVSDTPGGKESFLWAGIRVMVESWNISGLDLDKPVATPRAPVIKLLSFLIREIGASINGDYDKKK